MCAKDLVKRVLIAALLAFTQWQSAQAQAVPSLTIPPTDLQITAWETTTLMFSAPIKSVDRGSAAIVCKTIKGIDNILKVKAVDSSMTPTNLTVYTTDGHIYSFIVSYVPYPTNLVQGFGSDGGTIPMLFTGAQHTDMDIRRLSDSLVNTIGIRHRPRAKGNNGMHLVMSGTYLSKDLLFLQFKLSNFSRVRYDIDFIRYYISDRHQQKRTIRIEKEVKPLFVAYSQSEGVIRGHAVGVVAAFDKFTIADKKQFIAEVYEYNGDRRLICRVKGRQLLKVTPL